VAVSTAQLSTSGVGRRRAVVLTLVAVGVAVIGLSWAKWLPYTDRVVGIVGSGTYPGTSVLSAGAGGGAFARAWEFTLVYSGAVWKALLAALIISACVDVLVPRRWLLRVLGRRTPVGGSLAGGIAALPGMMCTCCSAPLAVTMRRAGVPVPAALAFWLGNPVLNPAVLVFLGLLAPASWVAVRVLLGVLLVFGFSGLVGSLIARRAAVGVGDLPPADRAVAAAAEDPVPWGEVPGRLLRSFARLAVVLVPEYLLVVFLVGLFSEPLGRVLGHGGVVAVVVAAVAGTVLVLPTGGEIPILLGLAAAGASAGVLGALLIALPALSLPSAVMVGRAMGWRVTAATAGATVVAAILAGGLLSALG
jgi:uncharacterized membrane protein YraQ (UPF0718 family)